MLPTITIDIGTTSVKLCLFDARADLELSARIPTPTTHDGIGEVYDVSALVGAVRRFIRELTPQQRAGVARIAIAGVGESGGLVAADLSLASPMILWHDHRGDAYLDSLTAQQRGRIYEITGLPVNGHYGVSKAAWAVAHADGGRAGAQWLNIAEYLAAVMTGERWSEPSLASRTMALDLRRGGWSGEIAELFGLDSAVFPELRPAAHGTAIEPGFARGTGLPESARVHVAGHDHMVGAVGAGLAPGELLNSTGTTEGLLLLGDAPTLDERAQLSQLANGRACDGEHFTLFASIPTGGAAFATLQHLLGMGPTDLSARIDGLHARYVAGEIEPGRAPLVLPRFRGSPPPAKDPQALGVIAGLRSDTSTDELILGCFLGLVLQFRDVLELLRVPAGPIRVIGPASSNSLWLQLKADLLGTPLSASRFPEVVSRGAQALASGQTLTWTQTHPQAVEPDARRHARLAQWSAQVAESWTYLKGVPT